MLLNNLIYINSAVFTDLIFYEIFYSLYFTLGGVPKLAPSTDTTPPDQIIIQFFNSDSNENS